MPPRILFKGETNVNRYHVLKGPDLEIMRPTSSEKTKNF